MWRCHLTVVKQSQLQSTNEAHSACAKTEQGRRHILEEKPKWRACQQKHTEGGRERVGDNRDEKIKGNPGKVTHASMCYKLCNV